MDPSDPQLDLPQLRDDEVGRDASPQLHAARDAARELLHTSQDLLTLARGELRLPLEMSVVSLAQVAARVSAEYEGVQFETPDEALVIASPERLAQVVRNLVRNAVQTASSPAGVRVNVTSDDEHATLEVADDGPGLNANALAHSFERHYTQRAGQGGSGIGLSTVHGLVQAHGGTVVPLEGPGGGALFRVRLPALGAPSCTSYGIQRDAVEAAAERDARNTDLG